MDMFTVEQVIDAFQRQVAGRLPPGVTLDESTRLDGLQVESLEFTEVLVDLENENGVRFDGARVREAATLGELTALASEPVELVGASANGAAAERTG